MRQAPCRFSVQALVKAPARMKHSRAGFVALNVGCANASVPEPESYAMGMVSFGVLWLMTRRRKMSTASQSNSELAS